RAAFFSLAARGSSAVHEILCRKHAASAAIAITTKADPTPADLAIRRVKLNATAAPSTTPPAVNARPWDITSRNRLDVSAPKAIRRPNSRVLCETVYDSTPYRP